MASVAIDLTRQEAKRLIAGESGPRAYLQLFKSAVKNASPAKRLEILRAMAQITVRAKRAGSPLQWKRTAAIRKQFNKEFGGFDVQEPCFVCAGPEWHHRHHVIQLQNGGGNSKANIVRLCRKCHSAVHRRRV